jgi:hypothetical protein
MFKEFINSLFNPNDKNEYLDKINDILFPIKCYLYIVIVLLVMILLTNIYKIVI